MSEEIDDLKSKIATLEKELDEKKSEVLVANCVKESMIELERRNSDLKSELTTLQHLLNESVQDANSSRTRYEHEMARIKAVLGQMETENKTLRRSADSVGGVADVDKDALVASFSDATKSLARKVKSAVMDKSPAEIEDEAMKRASEDTEVLKSIVVPLEEQIGALKAKLRETDVLLIEAERRQTLDTMDALSVWLKEQPSMESALATLESKESEGMSHDVLVAALKSRISILTSEMSAAKAETASSLAMCNKNLEQIQELKKQKSEQDSQRTKQAETEALKNLEAKLNDTLKKIEVHSKNEERLKDDLKKESEFRQTVESEWTSRAEQHKVETERLQLALYNSEQMLGQLQISWKTSYKETRKDLKALSSDREKIVRELKRLQDENDNLVGKHSAKAEEMQNEVINLPEKMDDIHMLLLRYRENLITAKLAKERLEERLQSGVSFLKTQMQAEQQSKEAIEDQLSTENDQLKEKIFVLESCKSELEAEQKRSKEYAEGRSKDQRANANLQKHLEKHIVEKQQLEAQLAEKSARIKNLQQELDNSVAVQTDFVRLSQSLQVELEKIRQSEKEVRWQHEDDIKDCQGCKHGFSGSTKRKHHCRHCGQVFCADCLQKSVPSGPQARPARVCEVCHTLLVQNSAPYFSTDPPNMNN